VATDGWGIDDGWEDTSERWNPAPPETIAEIRRLMAGDHPESAQHTSPPAGRPVWVVRPGQDEHLLGPCQLIVEGGDDLGELDHLPPDLPLGIHDLVPCDGGPTTTLIVSPRRCHLPRDLRTWGVTMQVPTTRSSSSWGIGDLGDVREVARWLGGLGAGALGLSPLHAPTPVLPIQKSPYYPSSRRWRTPLAIRIEDVPGAATVAEVASMAEAAERLRREPVVDRDHVWDLKRTALEAIWSARGEVVDHDLARWRDGMGDSLEGWARFCALAEVHGAGWSGWPAELQDPTSSAVASAAEELADRVAFHAWLQHVLERQLEAAQAPGVRLIQDLAIGVDPDGADAWQLQDMLALGASVGAPPDDFSRDGQSWGLPPFIPWKLREAGYRPFAELLRASMADGGGLRVDHVMGLSRLFWIPPGASPVDGTYVRFAGREMLDVLAMESARARAVVVGEDLGTVEPAFREELHDTKVLSTRLVWFEDDLPTEYPEEALAMVTTHDLPTIAGVWTGADEAELRDLERPSPEDAAARVVQRLHRLVDLPDGAATTDVACALHQRLAESPARLVLGTLEDACGVDRRPNVPGTTDERPNWSMSLPVTIDQIEADAGVVDVVEALSRTR